MSAATKALKPAITVNPEGIPAELGALPHWIGWQLEPDPEKPTGKPKKTPISPSGGWASVTNPGQWTSLDDALALAKKKKLAGVGFVFTADAPYTGLDFDGMTWEQVEPLVQDLLPAYVELSQSGKGIHVIVRGKLPPGPRRKGPIECYDTARYFAITGVHPTGDLPPAVLEDRTAALATFHATHLGGFVTPGATANAPAPAAPEEDSALLDRIRQTKFGKPLHRLYDVGEHGDERRASEADFDLACILCRFTPDDAQVTRLMWASQLRREKWEQHRTLVEITVRNARLKYPYQPQAATGPRWTMLTDLDLMAMPEPPWLVRHILARGCLTLLYAMKDTFKTFVALSISMAVAEGLPWLNDQEAFPTTRGTVVYVLAEGAGFAGRRVAAIRKELAVSDTVASRLRFVTVPVNLYEEGDVPAFISFVKAHLPPDEYPVLFVFDTFARSIVGAEENSNSDYSVSVDHAQGLQLEFGAAVLLVHHTGKDGLTARGGYALECASDIVIQLVRGEGDKDVQMVFEHVKDTAKPHAVGLRLHELHGSLVVRRNADDPSPVVTSEDKRTKAQGRVLSGRRRAIVDFVAKAKQPVTAEQIARKLDLTAKRAGEELKVLREGADSPLIAQGDGVKGSPYRYIVRDPVAALAGDVAGT